MTGRGRLPLVRLEGQVALVTGAGRGVGGAIALALSDAGAVGSDLAAELWDGCDAALASRLAYPEVRSGLAAAARNHDITETELDAAERDWDSYWAAVRPVEFAVVERRAGELTRAHALRAADAVHLASALASATPALSARSGTGGCTQARTPPAAALRQLSSTTSHRTSATDVADTDSVERQALVWTGVQGRASLPRFAILSSSLRSRPSVRRGCRRVTGERGQGGA